MPLFENDSSQRSHVQARVVPCHRPQYYPVDLHRKRGPVAQSTVNDSWPTTPYEPKCSSEVPPPTVKSILEFAQPRPLQPRRSDRKYRPWSWEFSGARYWPWLTIEQYIGEELRLRHDRKMPHRRPLWPPEPNPAPTVYAIDYFEPKCAVPVRETCCAEKPLVCAPKPPPPLTYGNFANWQWIP